MDARPAARAASFPEIESLRGLAILLVVLGHTDSWVNWRPVAAPIASNLLTAFVHAGHTGVSLFFVISAFLLSRPFLEEAAGGGRVDRRSYFRRRGLRILPLYWSAVLVTALACAQHAGDLFGAVYYGLFLNGFDGTQRLFQPYSSVWWSLATEVQFYLALPLLPLLLGSRRGRLLGGGLLLGYVAAYVSFGLGHYPRLSPSALNVLTHSLLGRAPLFASGIAAAWVWNHYGARLRLAAAQPWLRVGGSELVLLALLSSLAVLLRAVAARGYVGAEIGWPYWHVVEGVLWALLLLSVLLLPWRTKWLLCNPAVSTIGVLSYSIYLVHTPIVYRGVLGLGLTHGWTASSIVAGAGLLLVCVAVAAITYRYIERPWLRRKAELGASGGEEGAPSEPLLTSPKRGGTQDASAVVDDGAVDEQPALDVGRSPSRPGKGFGVRLGRRWLGALPTASPSGGPSFLGEVESLRGLAIVLVFLLHLDARVALGPGAPPIGPVSWLRAITLGGHTGVSLFFVLSGFLLSRPFLAATRLTGAATLRYYRRRARRILPLYVAAVLAAAVLCANHAADLWHGLPYVLFLQALPGWTVPLPPYSDVWWSLATEVQYYLLLPLLVPALRTAWGRRLGVLALSVYLGVYALLIVYPGRWVGFDTTLYLYHSLFGRLPLFAAGIVAGWVYDRWGTRLRQQAAAQRWWRWGGSDLVVVVALGLLVFALQRVVSMNYWVAETRFPFWHVLEGLVWASVLLAVLLLPMRLKRLLSNGLLEACGRISYSVYMWHQAVIVFGLVVCSRVWPPAAGGWNLRAVAVGLLLALVTAAVSALTYRWVERPFLRNLS